MLRHLHCCALALAVGGAWAADNAPRLSKYQLESGQLMLKQLRRDIEELHYDRTFKNLELDALVDAASARIAQARSNSEVFRAIAGFSRAFNDSHTMFQPPRWGFHFDYGWRALAAGKSCFIHRVVPGSDAERQGLKPGDQLLAINGVALSADTLRAWHYLLSVIEPVQSLKLTVVSPGAEARELLVRTTIKERPRNLDLFRDLNVLIREQSDREQRGRNVFHDFDGVLVWRLKHFRSEEEIADGLRKIRNHDRVVLDLRGNGGGLVGQVLRLTAVLLGKNSRIGVKKSRAGELPVVAELRGEKPWSGKLMVLIDRQSGSGAELVAAAIQQHGRGLLLGDRSAGAVQEGRVSIHQVGVERMVFYATMVAISELELEDGRKIEGTGVTPDFLMPVSGTDIQLRRDPVLAMALRQLGVTRRPEELSTVAWIYDPAEADIDAEN